METQENELKLIRITRPNYMGVLGPFVNEFVKKINPIGVTYESIWSYFANSVQFGQDQTEFWVAYYGETPTAFAHWYVMPLPHIGKACCDYIYSWNRKREPIEELLDKFIDFGERHRCPIYQGYAINEVLFRVWRKAAKKKKIGIRRMEIVTFAGRKEWAKDRA